MGASSGGSATGESSPGLRPFFRWWAGLPSLAYPAALLAQPLGKVGELVLEGELFAGVLACVVDLGSPDG